MAHPPITEPEIQEAIETEFECLRCGHCCKGEGAVAIGPEEADRMAEFLGLKRREFLRRYTIKVTRNLWWLRDVDNEEQWCIFLERDEEGLYGCRVNAAKPDQCRSFPAKWRNFDSFQSCAGLRALMHKLTERRRQEKTGTE